MEFTFKTKSKLFVALLLFLFASTHNSFAQTPVASFSTNPAHSGSSMTVCQGQTVVFTSTSTSTLGGASYTWSFGPGSLPTSATTTSQSVVFNTVVTNQIISLTVNNNNGSNASSATMQITVLASPNPLLTLLSTGSGFSTSTTSGATVFKNCSSSGSLPFLFNSNYNGSITQSINWGDGNTSNQTNFTGTQISHTYPVGQYTLTHTVTLSTGCTKTKTYTVFNGNAPVVTVASSSQSTCTPAPYSLDILANDVPINYTVNFSDGTPSLNFTTLNDTSVTHTFLLSSCGVDFTYSPLFPPIQNAFSATVVAQNLCSSNGFPTIFNIGPITISNGSYADFSYSPASPSCALDPVTFSNESTSGANISATGCDTTYSFYWKIVQPSGYTITSGTLGSNNGFVGTNYNYSLWTNGSEDLEVTFSTPGTYNVWIYTANFCGIDSIMKTVVIKPTATVSLTGSTQSICSGATSAPFTINSSQPGYTITWNITDTSNVSGVSTMTGSGTSPLQFNGLTLNALNNQQGVVEISVSVGCSSQAPVIYTIYVNPQATITANPITDLLCSGETTGITMTSNVAGATFSWTASGAASIGGESNGSGTAITQTLTNTGTSTQAMNYVISIGNVSCPGATVTAVMNVQPPLTINSNVDIAVCSGGLISPSNYSSTPSGASLTWTNSNTSIGIAASGTGQINQWNAPTNTSGNAINGTVIVAAELNGCPSVKDTFNVVINTTPSIQLVLNPTTGLDCINTACQINGVVSPSTTTVSWTGPSITSGGTTLTPTIGAAGTYTVSLTDPATGCSGSGSIVVDAPTQLSITSLNISPVTCNNGSNASIIVNTDNTLANLDFAWTPSISTSNVALNLSAGTYSVIVTNEDNCQADTSVTFINPAPLDIQMTGSVDSECGEANGQISVLVSGGNGGGTYSWPAFGTTGSVLINADAGTYQVDYVDALGCTISGTYSIGCVPLIPVFPTQFISPNNDGKNDKWVINNLYKYPDNKVTIFNRYGNVVFEAEPYNNDWDGTYQQNGTVVGPLPSATYFYIIDTKKKSQDPFKGYIEIQH
ncbi:MAG: gliding motility-associated C-terminal domain-containing protein [Crocinitomicaceae bacterium]|nr:gliding motility-associated C-terminal domain-containing protein [Crocinitomicaceae bacterium]